MEISTMVKMTAVGVVAVAAAVVATENDMMVGAFIATTVVSASVIMANRILTARKKEKEKEEKFKQLMTTKKLLQPADPIIYTRCSNCKKVVRGDIDTKICPHCNVYQCYGGTVEKVNNKEYTRPVEVPYIRPVVNSVTPANNTPIQDNNASRSSDASYAPLMAAAFMMHNNIAATDDSCTRHSFNSGNGDTSTSYSSDSSSDCGSSDCGSSGGCGSSD